MPATAADNPNVYFEERLTNVAEDARTIAKRLRTELADLRRDAAQVAERIDVLTASLPGLKETHELCEFNYRDPSAFRFPS